MGTTIDLEKKKQKLILKQIVFHLFSRVIPHKTTIIANDII